MMFDDVMGYAKDKKVLGKIVEYSAIKKETTILDANGNLHKSKDVVVLRKIGVFDGVGIFDRDVIKIHGDNYEIQLCEDGRIEAFFLDDYFNRTHSHPFLEMSKEKLLGNNITTLVGNIYELRDKLPKLDFNVKIVKEYDGTKYTYFYACNNKSAKEVDLIKVLFLGAKVLKDEYYERRTLSHKEYLNSIVSGVLEEVSEQELFNYILGASNNDKLSNSNLSIKKAIDDWKDSNNNFLERFDDDDDFENSRDEEDKWESLDEWY